MSISFQVEEARGQIYMTVGKNHKTMIFIIHLIRKLKLDMKLISKEILPVEWKYNKIVKYKMCFRSENLS